VTTTTNLNLKKPEQSDGINIADINGNMDTLDQQIKGLKDKFDPEGRAKDADRLGGMLPSDLALRDHNHSGVYAPATHSHTPAEAGATPAAHGQDGTIHVTAADKNNWNGKAAGSHVSDAVLHTTQAEKNKWNGTANTWIAASVINSPNGEFRQTIPNFVFTNGCTISFRIPDNFTPTPAIYITGITGGLGYYRLCTQDKQLVDGTSGLAAGAYISVILDNFYKPVAGREDIGTAFFKAGGASTPKFPTYTGSHAIFGTEKIGYMELYSSGTFTPKSNMSVEAFLVGGGSSGAQVGGYGAGGGAGGYVKLLTGVALTANTGYPTVIGSGGAGLPNYNSSSSRLNANGGGATSFVGNTVLGGSPPVNNGSGGDGGSGGGAGVARSGSSYYKAGDGGTNGSNGGGSFGSNNTGGGGTGAGVSTMFNGKTYAGGGGGGAGGTSSIYYSAGGLGKDGGGNGGNSSSPSGQSALANTGSGGGGAYQQGTDDEGYVNYYWPSGSGGSGIIIIRWGY